MRRFLFSKILFSIFLSVLFISCSNNNESVPVGVIEPAIMTEIFVDMQLVEAVLLHTQQKGMDANNYRKILYDKIFEKYKIKKEDFDKSFNYYSKNNIKLLDKIYADVISILSQKQSQIKMQ